MLSIINPDVSSPDHNLEVSRILAAINLISVIVA